MPVLNAEMVMSIKRLVDWLERDDQLCLLGAEVNSTLWTEDSFTNEINQFNERNKGKLVHGCRTGTFESSGSFKGCGYYLLYRNIPIVLGKQWFPSYVSTHTCRYVQVVFNANAQTCGIRAQTIEYLIGFYPDLSGDFTEFKLNEIEGLRPVREKIYSELEKE